MQVRVSVRELCCIALCVHRTWANTEKHQVVPGQNYHVESMLYVGSLVYKGALPLRCTEWIDLLLGQWNFTANTKNVLQGFYPRFYIFSTEI